MKHGAQVSQRRRPSKGVILEPAGDVCSISAAEFEDDEDLNAVPDVPLTPALQQLLEELRGASAQVGKRATKCSKPGHRATLRAGKIRRLTK